MRFRKTLSTTITRNSFKRRTLKTMILGEGTPTQCDCRNVQTDDDD